MLIFVLISLTCVSAADDNQTSDIVEISEIDEEIISEDTNDVGTFKDLSTEISSATYGSTIELTKDYTYNSTTDTSYKTNGIRFSTNGLVIDGKGHTISGAGQAQRIIYFSGSGLTIKNTIFTKSTNYGIYSSTGITLINCTFIDITGEAVYTSGNIANNRITNCTIMNTAGVSMAGTYVNCKFINNQARYSGGAIHSSVVDSSILRNCTFENNTAMAGGALYFNFPPTIIDCKFINNRATTFSSSYKGGGVISTSGTDYGSPSITNSIFINNTDPNGIAFYPFNDWKITNSTFQNSSVKLNSTMSNRKLANIEIVNSKFIDCNLVNINGNLTLTKNTFENGYIDNNGTILTQTYFIVPDYNQEYGKTHILLKMMDDNGNSIYDARIPEKFINLTIENENITLDWFAKIGENWYYTTPKELAEGKYNVNINLKNEDELNKLYLVTSMKNGTVEVGEFNNFASLNSEIASGSDIITLTKDYAFDITSDSEYLNGIVIDKDNVVIDGDGHTISGANTARIFNVTGQNVIFKNIYFINGFAANGGAIYSLSDITIENCNFINNIAIDNGGAVYVKNKGTVKNSQFNANQAANGGAIYFENDAVINNTKFYSNTAKLGGAAYINGNTDINNTEFVENTADRAGALYHSGTGTIDKSTFTSNNATKGLAIVEKGSIAIENTAFDDQTDGKWDNEIIKSLDGEVTLNNVTPKELDVRKYVDLIIDDGYNGNAMHYADYVFFFIQATNDGTVLENGTVTIRYNNTNYSSEINEGFAVIPVQILNVGNCTIYVSYYGGEQYEEPIVPVSLTIDRRESKINPSGIYTVAIDEIYTASLNTYPNMIFPGQPYESPLAGEKLIFKIYNGTNIINITAITNKDGVGVLIITEDIIKAVGDGYKRVDIIFEGNEYYTPSESLFHYINILNEISQRVIINIVENVTEVNEGEIYIASITKLNGIPIVNETMIFAIYYEDGFILVNSTTNKDGVGVLSITPDLIKIIGNGTKNILIAFEGNENKNLSEVYRPVQISIISGSELAPQKTGEISPNGTYTIDLKTDEGLPLVGADVNLTIGNTTLQSKTNENGTVSFNIPEDILNELKNGTQEATISYISNNYPHTITQNMTVKQILDTQITANAATYVINYGGTYSVTLKDANGKALSGKTITFTLNGKNIGSAVTNANGVASIKLTASILKTAKAGSKNLVIKFNGDTDYNTVSKTVKIKINKEKTKIKAKKKTFKKAKKVKKYKITLKDSKGKAIKKVKVTLKIKGKTYKAKTNKKGKATFKIKKLTKKGKYKAKIKFKATANYLKATKKVKIKIK